MAHDTFISYSRKDRAFAIRLQKALANYTPPKDLPLPHRRVDVFRDEEDFTGAEYYESLDRHLTNSSKLIVLCSPAARASRFVDDEIRRFGRSRGTQHIIPLLVAGIPNNEAAPGQEAQMAFPDALCESMQMPLAADYRDFDPRRSNVDRGRYEASWYTTLANIFDISRAQIEQREKKRRARRRRITLAAGAASAVVLVCLSFIAWKQRQEAIQQARVAEARFLAGRAAAIESMSPSQGLRLRTLVAAESLRAAWTNEGYRAWRLASRQMPPVMGRIKTDSALIRMAFTPDARTLLALCGKRHLHVFSVPDLRESKMVAASETAFELAVDPHGKQALAYQANDEFIEAFDISNGTKRSIFTPGAIRAAAFTPAGEAIVVSSAAVWVIDAHADQARSRVAFPAGATWVALSPDGTTALALTDRTLTSYDTGSGSVRWQTPFASTDATRQVLVSGDGRSSLVAGATDLLIVDTATGEVNRSLPVKAGSRVRPILLSADYYAIGNDLYAATGAVGRVLPFADDVGPLRFPAVSPSGRYIAGPSEGVDQSVAVVDLSLAQSLADDSVAFYLTLEAGHRGSAIAFTTGGETMALSSSATGLEPDAVSELQLVSLKPERWRTIIPSRSRTGDLVVLPPDARVVANPGTSPSAGSFTADGTPVDADGNGTFASSGGRYVARLERGKAWVINDTVGGRRLTVPDNGSPIEFSPDEQRVLVYPEIHALGGQAQPPQKVPGAGPFLYSWSFPGSDLVIGIVKDSWSSGDSKQSVLFDWKTGAVSVGPGSVHSLYAVSPDGRRFATYDYETIKIWTVGATKPDIQSGRAIASHDTPLHFSPDGTLLTVAKCGSAPLYDTTTLALRFEIPLGNGCFAGFSRDGKHVVSRAWHSGVPEPTLHPITLDGVLEQTCARVRDNLTSREWERMGAPARTTCLDRGGAGNAPVPDAAAR